MKTLLLADKHLTDNPLDEYRWGVFEWIKDIDEKYKIDFLYILGDLTERKDRHSAQLVNRVVKELNNLWDECGIEVIILKGNHDFIDSDTPFFGFLHGSGHISYVLNAEQGQDPSELFLPYTATPDEDWKDIDFSKYERIYMHQSVIGSIANNGMEMKEGLPGNHRIFQEFKGEIYSGHIHKAQEMFVGPKGASFIYVGSPYPVYFGDIGEWRGLLLNNKGEVIPIFHPTITRHMIDIGGVKELKKHTLKLGDQCKVRLKLHRADYHMWAKYRDEIKEYIEKKGVQLVSLELVPDRVESVVYDNSGEKMFGFSDVELIEQFSVREKLTDGFMEVAKELVI